MRKRRSPLPDGEPYTSPLAGEVEPAGAAGAIGRGARRAQLSRRLTRVDLELPDGRYLLSYGHHSPRSDA